jgi:hypothetical protein
VDGVMRLAPSAPVKVITQPSAPVGEPAAAPATAK